MAYTTSTEIQSDFKDIEFGDEKAITADDVDQFIKESDALINSYLSNRYVVPVAAGEGLQLVKLLSRSLTAARIKKILEVKQEKSTDANQNVLSVLLSVSKVMEILEDLKNGDSNLIGAEELSQKPSGFFSKNAACGVEFRAKKDETQW